MTREKKYVTFVLFAVMLGLTTGTARAAPEVLVGFSPEGTAQQLVLKTIESAQQEIRLMGYSFTSPEVVSALIRAKRRGVDVKVALDAKGNSRSSSRAAINLLINADVPVRLVSEFNIMHDKVIISDERTTETGSFNFSRAAASSNSENVIVLKDLPGIASQYLAHWQSRWEQGKPATSTY